MHPLSTIKKRMHHFEIFNFKVNTSSEPPFRSKNLNPLKNTSVTAPVTPFHQKFYSHTQSNYAIGLMPFI